MENLEYISDQSNGFLLSPQQRRAWILDSCEQKNVVRSSILIDGALEQSKLESALKYLISRHEILRTTYRKVSGILCPLQYVEEGNEFALVLKDFSELDELDKNKALENIFSSLLESRYDLVDGSPFTAILCKKTKNEHVLYIALPAISADAQTVSLIYDELLHIYAGDLAVLSEQENLMQYADVAQWLTEVIESEDSPNREFWKSDESESNFRDTIPGKRKGGHPRAQPSSISLPLSENVFSALINRARALDTSAKVYLLTCWQVLVYRLIGNENIVIGTGFDGRKFDELNSTLGAFDKNIPVLQTVDNETPFADLVKRNSQLISDYEEFQEFFDWEDLLGDMGQKRLAYSPVKFDYRELPDSRTVSDVSFKIGKIDAISEPFDIRLSCVVSDNALVIHFDYDESVFSSERVKILKQQFETLLGGSLVEPEDTIKKLNLLSESERKTLLSDFNVSPNTEQQHRTIAQYFEGYAEHSADELALVFESQELSYKELNIQANKLAHYLLSCGICTGDRVGICFLPSVEMIIAMLAVVKAGAAYVPIDSTFPAERINYIGFDSGLKILLTQEGLLNVLQEVVVDKLAVDSNSFFLDKYSADNLCVDAHIDELIYMIYTSGSTGKPKGVAISHRSLSNYIAGVLSHMDLSANAQMAAFSAMASDLGNTSIFGALCSGRTLRVFPKNTVMDGELLAEKLNGRPLDVLKIVPSHLAALMTIKDPQRILPKSYLILGGEATDLSLIEKVRQLAPACQIINHYGPTETTVGATCHVLDKGTVDYTRLPIGKPLGNLQAYILNEVKELISIGEIGHLHLSGYGLARGYWNQAKLTAEKFLPNPYGEIPGGRLYETGDLARYNEDGTIEFLGRADFQVKIRGYRVELGEVESNLLSLSDVKDAAVIYDNSDSNAPRFSAHVVTDVDSEAFEEKALAELSEKLPDYMVPEALHVHKSFPLTINGKIDRKALIEESLKKKKKREYISPKTDIQKKVAELWKEQLAVERVGLNDDFFHLGGHSLAIVTFVNKARQAFSCMVSIDDVFNNPTVEKICQVIEGKASDAEPALTRSMVLVKKSDSKKNLYFILPRGGESAINQLREYIDFDGSIYALVPSPFAVKNIAKRGFSKTVLGLTKIYMEEMRIFQPDGPYYVGGYAIGRSVAYEVVKQLGENERKGYLFTISSEQYNHFISQEISSLGVDNSHLISDERSSPIVELKKPKINRNLILISPLGCITCYSMLMENLDFDGGIYGFQIPEITTGERPKYLSVPDLAKLYLDKLLKIQEKGPYYFAGASIGGCIAYEMAVLLEERGEEVAFVGLLDSIFARLMDWDLKNIGPKERDFILNECSDKSSDEIEAILAAAEEKDGQMEWQERFHLVTSLSNLLHIPKKKIRQVHYFCALDCEEVRMKNKLDHAKSLSENKVIRYDVETSHHHILVELINVFEIGDIFSNILNEGSEYL